MDDFIEGLRRKYPKSYELISVGNKVWAINRKTGHRELAGVRPLSEKRTELPESWRYRPRGED